MHYDFWHISLKRIRFCFQMCLCGRAVWYSLLGMGVMLFILNCSFQVLNFCSWVIFWLWMVLWSHFYFQYSEFWAWWENIDGFLFLLHVSVLYFNFTSHVASFNFLPHFTRPRFFKPPCFRVFPTSTLEQCCQSLRTMNCLCCRLLRISTRPWRNSLRKIHHRALSTRPLNLCPKSRFQVRLFRTMYFTQTPSNLPYIVSTLADAVEVCARHDSTASHEDIRAAVTRWCSRCICFHPVAPLAKQVLIMTSCKSRLLSNPGLRYKNGPLQIDYDVEQVLSENVLSITIVDSGTTFLTEFPNIELT